ncbi:bifunctional 2-C-methyl-D-erythritol 4-phosphate cytidylyltransferase/2-C-methyl-D-erythritol 2,4-cyclodiphosphate synthase [Sphingomonas sp. LB-2]|uniref:bifunctional 2-C-methyl-D-erythritol 4-phosphate cytidylyltransferase/2-C-methyl-D-erythritol 2,4-cyclodiphosphate synthase n=1 Tax=Sphingomonas caeni TaxID=2984949 RepID=UPI0022309148|nr:bifunctional 2-C-methyl-D-erythritol 4-phosphate cytidylyltransferase/2-C-methyl-D-erythritol 2,4-cyclodiphosphate synthase [Sphingomonas caeni]MCW3849167.1 bifunctional 2-C-methyl-D-erythritol 4-phosphate cytidylyltransferase/2-C-methyl-D-erythritol 2,4-cyclodiphosphate synthase [Sphingomonas caeni]
MERTSALIVAAGLGTRAGTQTPKQFAPLGGKPMVAHSVEALAGHAGISDVTVVVAAAQLAQAKAALGDGVQLVIGGSERKDSVQAGLEALAGTQRVLVHDAARPFLTAPVIDRLIHALDKDAGAVPVLPVADTLARSAPAEFQTTPAMLARGAEQLLGDTVQREGLYRVQTPQAFRYEAILEAHRRWPEGQAATDDAQMLRAAGFPVAMVAGDPALEKITYAADFAVAEARIAASMRVRTAQGFDVHRFEPGGELWLGGIRIPSDRGLSGHSDADVALHAITDALLGTIGAGDIGMHFPPSDPQWRGAASAKFLQHAAGLIGAVGGVIDFIDLTLICEAPKIGPHREAIRASIASILGVPPGRISVKATTTERLGFTGRGEGMAAQAMATVRLPETSA